MGFHERALHEPGLAGFTSRLLKNTDVANLFRWSLWNERESN